MAGDELPCYGTAPREGRSEVRRKAAVSTRRAMARGVERLGAASGNQQAVDDKWRVAGSG